MTTIAIIGAGVSGTYLAHQLKQEPSIQVTIVDKSRGVGGRCSVRHWQPWSPLPHGAQFMTFKTPEGLNARTELLEADAIRPVNGNFGYFDATDGRWTAANPQERFIGKPLMNSFLKHWLGETEFIPEVQVTGLSLTKNKWQLQSKNESLANRVFDSVVCTAPLPQTNAILGDHKSFALPAVSAYPCLALLLVTKPVSFRWQRAFLRGTQISWLSQSTQGDHQYWVVHGSGPFSEQYLEGDRKEGVQQLKHELANILSVTKLDVLAEHQHFWRYASIKAGTAPSPFLFDSQSMLGCVGDWFCGGRIEGAMSSAHQLYSQHFRHLNP